MTLDEANKAIGYFERLSSPMVSIVKLAGERNSWGEFGIVIKLRSKFLVNGQDLYVEARYSLCPNMETALNFFKHLIFEVAQKTISVNEEASCTTPEPETPAASNCSTSGESPS